MRLVLEKKNNSQDYPIKFITGRFRCAKIGKIWKFLGKIALFHGFPTPPLFKKAALTSPPSLQALMRADSFPP